jgi:hypothetical protein
MQKTANIFPDKSVNYLTLDPNRLIITTSAAPTWNEFEFAIIDVGDIAEAVVS